MRKFLVIVAILIISNVYAGNPDRVGQAGAYELNMNAWGRSSGLGHANVAYSFGIESFATNISGLAFTKNLEIYASHSMWMRGSGLSLSNIGLAKKIGESGGSVGVYLSSLNQGEVAVTTVENPEGTGAYFRPRFINGGVAYVKSFTNSIHGGLGVKFMNESVANVSASSICLDAGITYIGGKSDNIRFGIAIRNVGLSTRFKGEGLTNRYVPSDASQNLVLLGTYETDKFELPTQLLLGLSYGIKIDEKNKINIMGQYTSNSFSNNKVGLGVEYDFKEIAQLRVAYGYEDNVFGKVDDVSLDKRVRNINGGLSVGGSVQLPLGKGSASKIAVHYSYRPTQVYKGTHTFGLGFNF